MAKGTNYFSHDFNTKQDEKIKKLLRKHGLAGYGLYWSIIECLYQNANAIEFDCKGIAYDQHCDEELVQSVITEFDLFVVADGVFGSNSVQKRMDLREEKSNKLAENGRKSWQNRQKHKESEAIAEQMDTKSKAIKGKERKVKESKVKEVHGAEAPTPKDILEKRKIEFGKTLIPHLPTYGQETLREFYEYWTEPNKSHSKFKQEMQDTWDLERRLRTWAKRDNGFNKTTNEQQQSTVSAREEKDRALLTAAGI